MFNRSNPFVPLLIHLIYKLHPVHIRNDVEIIIPDIHLSSFIIGTPTSPHNYP